MTDDEYTDPYADSAFPPYPGHPHWCGTIDYPLECGGPNHERRLGAVVGHGGPVTVMLTQVADEPRVTLVGDDGPLLVVPFDQLEHFSWLVHCGNVIGHGGWPEYTVA